MNPILLDERLSAAAELAQEALAGIERPVAADIGCDHGFLTAKLLETVPNLTMLASDVSAPSLEKARRLLAERGLTDRAALRRSSNIIGFMRSLRVRECRCNGRASSRHRAP